ncbi:hypothetical protein [Psychrobacillus sp. NPDC096389]|uniref:hypothetical protein n=1 Tax=Psychrobacillus sp. NPDC096389 TaxID=3364490 RepID=UPI0037FC4CE8
MHQIFLAKDLVKIEITCIVFLMLKRGKIKNNYQNSIVFFDKHLPGTLEIIDQEIFELTKEEHEEHQRDMEDYYHEVAMSKIT